MIDYYIYTHDVFSLVIIYACMTHMYVTLIITNMVTTDQISDNTIHLCFTGNTMSKVGYSSIFMGSAVTKLDYLVEDSASKNSCPGEQMNTARLTELN